MVKNLSYLRYFWLNHFILKKGRGTMKSLTVLLAILLFCTFASGQSVEDYLAKGDAAYDNNDDEAALVQYKTAFETDNSSCDAAWKTSRAYSDIGDTKEEDEERTKLFTLAEEYARKAIEICPNSDMAHLQLSIAIGRVALMSGKKKQVQLSQSVKDEAEKALELNPNNDTAHHVYARWHRKVATLSGVAKAFAKVLYGGLPPASLEKAEEHFEKAIELNPEHINHYYEAGLTYEMSKKWQKAADCYKKVAELPAKDSEDEKHKRDAAERLIEVNKML